MNGQQIVNADMPVLREGAGLAVTVGATLRPRHPALYQRTLSAWDSEAEARRHADPETTVVVPEGDHGVHLIVMRT